MSPLLHYVSNMFVVWETVFVTSVCICMLFLVSVTTVSMQKVTADNRDFLLSHNGQSVNFLLLMEAVTLGLSKQKRQVTHKKQDCPVK